MPENIWNIATRNYRAWRHEIAWRIKRDSWVSAQEIMKLKNLYKDERCFIIGNGPSLNDMDLSPLQNEYTFGLNRIYLLFPKMGFKTSFHVCVNTLIIEQFADELGALDMPQFLSNRGYKFAKYNQNTMFLHSRSGLKFSKLPQLYIYEGATVTYSAMQLAFFMGFRDVFLIGVDHNFVTKGMPNKKIVSIGEDRNHFDPNYFGKGVRWQLPDLQTSEKAYLLAQNVFVSEGRSIYDATIGGKLTIFPKVQYATLF